MNHVTPRCLNDSCHQTLYELQMSPDAV